MMHLCNIAPCQLSGIDPVKDHMLARSLANIWHAEYGVSWMRISSIDG